MTWLDRDDRLHRIEPQFRLVRHIDISRKSNRRREVREGAAMQGCDAGLIRTQLS
jgi:hypothetical protein